MTAEHLRVGRRVVRDMVRLAAVEVPGVVRVGWGGPAWRRILSGRPIRARVRDGCVDVRIVVVARPGQALASLAAEVRSAVRDAVERLLALEVGEIRVVVDGVGG